MNLRLFWKRARLAFLFACCRPHIVFSAILQAIYVNWTLIFACRKSKVFVLSVEDVNYLPFIEGALVRIPERDWKDIYLVVSCRKFSRDKVCGRLRSLNIEPSLAVSNWVCALILIYDLFLTTHQSSAVPIFGHGPRVCSFHGLPAKGGTFVESQWRFLDIAFLIGPLQKRMFEEFCTRYPMHGRRLGYREIGLIKSDDLLNGSIDKQCTRKELEIKEGVPVILYAPSWEKGTSLHIHAEAVFENIVSDNWQTLVKLHPMSYFPPHETKATGGIDWSTKMNELAEQLPLKHIPKVSIDPLLAVADVLITDVSSVAFEAFLVDIPVVFIDCPEFFEQTVQEMYSLSAVEARSDLRFNCGRQAGVVNYDITRLREDIQRCLNAPTEFAGERELIRKQLVFNEGRAGEVAAVELTQLLFNSRRSNGLAKGLPAHEYHDQTERSAR